jgi:hypothetical protein
MAPCCRAYTDALAAPSLHHDDRAAQRSESEGSASLLHYVGAASAIGQSFLARSLLFLTILHADDILIVARVSRMIFQARLLIFAA